MHVATTGAQISPRLPYKWMVTIVVMVGAFMSILDQTIVTIALPQLQQTFGTDLSHVQWVLTAYILTQAILTPTTAYFVMRLGTRRFYILALALFTASSAFCGLAPSLPLLILFRILQAIGGASLFPLATTMLYNEFPVSQRGVASSLLAIAALLGPAVGPTLGGYFVAYTSWHWIFFINLPVGLLGIVLALLLLRKGQPVSTARFDAFGFGLSAFGLSAFLFALSSAQGLGWTSLPVLVALVGGGLSLAGFVLVERSRARSHQQVLVDLSLLANKPFLLSSLATMLITFAFFGSLFLFPLYLQNLRGLNAFQTGLLLLPQAGISLVVALVGGRLVDRFGVRVVVLPGLVVLVVSFWQLTPISLSTSYAWLQVLFLLRGIGLGLIVQPMTVSALSTVPRDLTAQATSLLSVIRFISTSLGIAVLATLVQAQTAAHLSTLSGRAPLALAQAQISLLALQDAFWVILPVLLAAIVVVCLIPTRQPAPHQRPVVQEGQANTSGAYDRAA
jgi:EmrB/QacA subfamily drug resistance transporter